VKSFTQFIGESEEHIDTLPVLHELEESGEHRPGEVIKWFKENIGVVDLLDIVEHDKTSPFYDIMQNKHHKFIKLSRISFVPWSRISIGPTRLEWFKERRYAVLIDNKVNEPLCFWIAKSDEYLFYSDTTILDKIFGDF
jgi:hypothetical protein